MAITSAGLIMLCFLTAGTSVVFVVAVLVIMGVGFSLFSSPNSNAIMSSVEKRQLGNASGMLGTMRNVGQTFSMAIALMLLALFMGQAKIDPGKLPAASRGNEKRFRYIFSALLCRYFCLAGTK